MKKERIVKGCRRRDEVETVEEPSERGHVPDVLSRRHLSLCFDRTLLRRDYQK